MRYVGRAVILFSAAALAYAYLTAEVPGGEKRYEQFLRQVVDRHSGTASLP